jgi:hypothetical protein
LNLNNIAKAQSITINQPTTSSRWNSGKQHIIIWTASGITNVDIEYSTNGGANYFTIATSVDASSGSISWDIPSAISSNQCRIRIKESGGSTTATTGNFTIGYIQITQPTAGAVLQAGSSFNLTWSRYQVTNVSGFYSIDGGQNWTILFTSSNSGNYNWNPIPNTPSSNCRIRIVDAAGGSSIFEISPTFSIVSLQLTSPSGAVIEGGTQFPISWTANGVSQVNLYFSLNGVGGPWTLITTTPISAGSSPYVWNVPTSYSSNVYLRVQDAAYSSIYSNSSSANTIANITITDPTNGTKLFKGVIYNIQWQKNQISSVNVSYTTNNGGSWTSISTNNAGTSVGWAPPASGNNYKIRVFDAAGSGVDDTTEVITVASINVVYPNGGAVLNVGQNISILWTSEYVNSVNILYSSNNGTSWNTIVSNQDASTGNYTWTVPDIITNQLLIRIADVSNPSSYYDQSDAANSIAKIQVVNPSNGVKLVANKIYQIRWNKSGVNAVNILYSTNGGSSWNPIPGANNLAGNTFDWTVPNEPSNNCKIKIEDAAASGIVGYSTGTFTISKLQLIYPNGGEVFQTNKTGIFQWNSAYVSYVNIKYSTNGGTTWQPIVANRDATTGTYTWPLVPNVGSNNVTYRIEDVDDPTNNFDLSDGPNTIGLLEFTNPLGGEHFQVGNNLTITWNSSGNLTTVDIYYSLDDFATQTPVATGVNASAGSINWIIPNIPSNNVKLKIKSGSVLEDVTPAFVVGNLQVVYPNGGEFFFSGENRNIQWRSWNVRQVRIEYSTDAGGTWNLIKAPEPSLIAGELNSYVWTVPSIASNQYRVRVSEYNYETDIFDISNANFTVSSIDLLTPNAAGLIFDVGSVVSITWLAGPALAGVNIEYTTNNGLNWITIQNGVSPTAGSYNWTVPNTPTNQGRVRVYETGNLSVMDQSDNMFTIRSLTLIQPNGGSIQASRNYQIQWTNISTVTNVKN